MVLCDNLAPTPSVESEWVVPEFHSLHPHLQKGNFSGCQVGPRDPSPLWLEGVKHPGTEGPGDRSGAVVSHSVQLAFCGSEAASRVTV